jgi:TolB-like protein
MRQLILIVALWGLSGCTSLTGAISGVSTEHSNRLISSSYRAVDQLVNHQAHSSFAPGQKILVATVVNLNNLNESSTFGRLVAEHASSRLVQLGANVTELKLRGNLFVSEKQGELLLSREVKEISSSYNADAVLVGTYADSLDRIYVTLKLIRAQDAQIVSAYNYAIEKHGPISGLLRN